MQRQFTSTIFLGAIAIIFLLSGCAEEQEVPELLRPVRFEEVFSTGGDRWRQFSGVAQAGLKSRLSFKVAGTIKRLHVKVGDRIRAGKLIAELDESDYQLQYQQARASLESARAQARNAEASYQRVRQLYENRNASRNDLDAARAANESAAAQVAAQENQMELSRLQLSYTKLKAPVDGAIAELDVEVNENVSSGQTIVSLSSGSNIEVSVAIPSILISQVRNGDAVKINFDAVSGQEFAGRVTEVGVASTGFATTYPVKVRLEDVNESEIRPGMAAEVYFQFGKQGSRERMIVPSVAVGEDRNGRFVFTLESSDEEGIGIVRRHPVAIGDLSNQGLEILEGLEDGSLVVTAGVSKLVDGQRVKFGAPDESQSN